MRKFYSILFAVVLSALQLRPNYVMAAPSQTCEELRDLLTSAGTIFSQLPCSIEQLTKEVNSYQEDDKYPDVNKAIQAYGNALDLCSEALNREIPDYVIENFHNNDPEAPEENSDLWQQQCQAISTYLFDGLSEETIDIICNGNVDVDFIVNEHFEEESQEIAIRYLSILFQIDPLMSDYVNESCLIFLARYFFSEHYDQIPAFEVSNDGYTVTLSFGAWNTTNGEYESEIYILDPKL